MSERFDLLLASLLDDHLDAAGRDELAALLAENPSLQRRYVQLVQQHAALRTVLTSTDPLTKSAKFEIEALRGLDPHSAAPQASATGRKRRPLARRSRRARSSAVPALLGLALLVLVGIGAWWLGSAAPPAPLPPAALPVARPAPAPQPGPAAAVLLAAGQLDQLEVGAALRIGQRYQVGAAGAELRCDDGTRLQLTGGSGLRFEQAGPPQRIFHLDQGRVEVTAAAQAQGQVLAIHSPELRSEVVGTRFSVSHGDGGSELVVDEGRVRVQLPTGEWQQLSAGERFHSRERTGFSDPRWQLHGDLPWSVSAEAARFALPEHESWRGRALIWTEPVAVAEGFELRARLILPPGLAGRWHVELAAVAELELDSEAQARQMLRLNADEEAVEVLLLHNWYHGHRVIERRPRPLAPGEYALLLRIHGDQVVATIDGEPFFSGRVEHGYQQVHPSLRVSRKGASAGEIGLEDLHLQVGLEP